tara:strand:+ start:2745 stop:3026 length:282 start_codon:yes stop_codon:yes gene_type:complete
MSIEVLDPTYGGKSAAFALASRVGSLQGKTIGVISNGKRGTRPFFAALERTLLDEMGAARVVMHIKSNYSAPADAHIMQEAPEWDAAFVGIGD